MNITERDLFLFVFFQEKLSQERIEYLKTSQIFDEEIEFYRSLKMNLENDISEELKHKIAEKIPLYSPTKFIMLYPVNDNVKKRKNGIPILAAASPKEEPYVKTKTFIDEHNHYLIRLLNFKSSSKIYVFSTIADVIKNYKVVIYPSGQIFEQADNSAPIEIDSKIEAEKIELQFN